MVLVLCIGDMHVPHRAEDFPAKFKELLKPGKIHHILCCGNLCSKAFKEQLRQTCADLHITQGDFDDFSSPDQLVKTIGQFKIGLCHGHQIVPWGDLEALAIFQRQLDVDILVSGHTHQHKVIKYQDCLLINPGSATGAYSTVTRDVLPSFVLMDLDGNKAVIYVYQLQDGEVKVDKIDYTKPTAAATPVI